MVKDMTRTEKILYILIVLVVSFIIFLFYQNFDKINKNINEFITSVKEPKINIPNDKIIYNRKYSYKTVHDTDNFSPKNIDDDLLVSFLPMSNVSEQGNADLSIIRKYKEVKKGFTSEVIAPSL